MKSLKTRDILNSRELRVNIAAVLLLSCAIQGHERSGYTGHPLLAILLHIDRYQN
jgi:hypothetical protein